MSATRVGAFAAALARIPVGTSTGKFGPDRYLTTRSLFNAGKSTKLIAEKLGSTGYISLNFYDLQGGAHLRPCEMSADKVINFVLGYQPDQGGTPDCFA